jgi:hypothetical protein
LPGVEISIGSSPPLADPPERRRAFVAQRCIWSAGEYRRHEQPLARQRQLANRVDTAPDDPQPAACEPVSDRLGGKSETDQLLASNDSVLGANEGPDGQLVD